MPAVVNRANRLPTPDGRSANHAACPMPANASVPIAGRSEHVEENGNDRCDCERQGRDHAAAMKPGEPRRQRDGCEQGHRSVRTRESTVHQQDRRERKEPGGHDAASGPAHRHAMNAATGTSAMPVQSVGRAQAAFVQPGRIEPPAVPQGHGNAVIAGVVMREKVAGVMLHGGEYRMHFVVGDYLGVDVPLAQVRPSGP